MMEEKKQESTVILDIQRSSRHDGPGLRTTVFLKGCALRCAWCHNPESQAFEPQLMFNREKCTLCGKCAAVCPEAVHLVSGALHTADFAACKACGRCSGVCPTGALSVYGMRRAAAEVFRVVQRDKVFYEHTGGGVTISGGEPFLHEKFCQELMMKCREERIHICVETSGQAPAETFCRLAPLTDLFLFDYKTTGKRQSLRWTGADGSLIADNLHFVLKQHKKVILRCPVIPGVNDTGEHFDAIAELVSRNADILRAEILPYHNFGVIKRENAGLACGPVFQMPENGQKEAWMDHLKRRLGEKVCWG